MKPAYLKWAFGLSLCGTLFAGYLTFYKLLAKTCAFSEPCPTFLGYPACWYGLAMFGTLSIASAIGLFGRASASTVAKIDAAISFLGILFAGYFTWREIASWLAGAAPKYALGLPTCSFGLIFYVAIFAASSLFLRRHARTIVQ